jgi:hypothetical protein
VAYTKSQRAERTKLATLGVDNRSTATTIMAIRALIELQSDHELKAEARKLLSFTDNRQDASLQAGHFNDFAKVALLRSALHRAAQAKGAGGLSHRELPHVFDAMQPASTIMPPIRSAGPGEEPTHDALRRVIDITHRDLQRGWRSPRPTSKIAAFRLVMRAWGRRGPAGKEVWESGFTVRTANGGEEFVETPEPCAPARRVRARSFSARPGRPAPFSGGRSTYWTRRNSLTSWSRPNRGFVRIPYGTGGCPRPGEIRWAYPRPKKNDRRRLQWFFVSSTVARTLPERTCRCAPGNLGRREVDQVIGFLLLALKRYGIVEQVRSGRDGNDPGYQINADALRWLPGDGEIRPIDRTRLLDAGEMPPEVNRYFVECYRRFVDLKCVLEAREHTAHRRPRGTGGTVWPGADPEGCLSSAR